MKLERMAVERRLRGSGVGSRLLAGAEEFGRERGARRMVLHAQTHAQGFYAANGYEPEGELFIEAGIEHVRMSKHLARPMNAEGAQPEIRIDQLTGLRTILAAGRADRPIELEPATRETLDPSDCPFCEGNESKTPPEIWADRPGGGPADGPGWRVRAVPNLYPALSRRRRRRPEAPPAPRRPRTRCARRPARASPTCSPRSPRGAPTR